MPSEFDHKADVFRLSRKPRLKESALNKGLIKRNSNSGSRFNVSRLNAG